ncbi:MAG: lysine--tRNA ligase [Deltaproteobacteria bacterium CG11_big_fil_rev_8_21_14_0_20_47_16]|nr:MAG: lysine--tRNA ligase [Deltaproteobacteria bacterium CG11_big_fil_rev_8_21_14_0_20_47_16]
MSSPEEHDEYYAQRLKKAEQLREKGENPYANTYHPNARCADLVKEFGEATKESLEAEKRQFKLAGRVMAIRSFGKAAFVQLQDGSQRFQIFVQKNSLSPEAYERYQLLDLGDIAWFDGFLFRTKTNELTLHAEDCRVVSKALRGLPEKWHGLTDVEVRYRQRYLDMAVNPEVRETFVKRSKVLQVMRDELVNRGFLEVETPMMHPIPGGAAARPFVTHHNTLDMDLYLRIAPELYLKRLLVGGLERVFEINRNFRNEGISIQHNPEFTMLELYQTYATYEDLIVLTQDLLNKAAVAITGSDDVMYQERKISFKTPFARYTMMDALREIAKVPEDVLSNRDAAVKYALDTGIKLKRHQEGLGAVLAEIFDVCVQPELIQPTFITQYPTEISPLARKNETDPKFTDRFELFIFGREIANAFSELNDPVDQADRFRSQVAAKEKGDDESMHFDADYVRALEHGMPPAAGLGVGIDRVVMLLTNAASIRDVILFPQLRKNS